MSVRVLQIMATGARGGGARHLLLLVRELAAQGYDCSAVVGTDGPLDQDLRASGVPVETLDMMHSRVSPKVVRSLAAHVSRQRPRLVHYHGTRAAFFGALTKLQGFGTPPAVYTIHGLSYRQEVPAHRRMALLSAELLACRAASRVISVSRTDMLDLCRRRFVRTARTCHIPNCIDPAEFYPGSKSEARSSLGLPEDAFLVGTSARLVPQKAVGDLVQAARYQRFTLVVAGDGPQRSSLTAQARRLGVRAVFLGERTDVGKVLRALDVFALSSHWEGEPIALLEAMATGVPCVASATQGAREVLSGTGAGLLVEVGKSDELGAALESLRCASKEHLVRMGEAGMRTVRQRQPACMAQRVAALYEEVLSRRPSR